VRLLKKEGADVRLILTDAARDFVTPLTLSTLSEHPVENKPFDPSDGSWHSHIELGNWADIFLIAPVTATTLAKLANGIADNLLLATYLAARCPVYFAPAMDLDMYRHPTTRANIDKLISYGNILIEPTDGELASGLCGAGRLQEPEEIVRILSNHFEKKKDFKNKRVLISAGPTYERIDPVRYIGNFSSGKMGYALAEEFAERGAKVELVSGPVQLNLENKNIHITRINAAKEMEQECLNRFPDAEITVMAAAIADYTVDDPAKKKIKKKKENLTLQLVPTTDILKLMGERKKKGQFLVGFALESNDELIHAQKKLKNKNLDLIVLNSLKDKGAGFGHDTNKITLLDSKGGKESFELKSKREVARDIVNKILTLRSL